MHSSNIKYNVECVINSFALYTIDIQLLQTISNFDDFMFVTVNVNVNIGI